MVCISKCRNGSCLNTHTVFGRTETVHARAHWNGTWPIALKRYMPKRTETVHARTHWNDTCPNALKRYMPERTKMVHARTHWNETCPNSLARYMNTQYSILKTQYSIFSTADPWFEQRIADKPNYPPCPIMRVKLNEWLNNSHLPSTFKFQFILVWAWALVPLVQIALQKNNV